MNRAGSPARSVMRTLRTGLSQPPGSDLSPLLPLVRQALAFIDRGAVDDPATAGEASELAFLLAALLEAGDEHFRLQAFGLLFRLGVEGELLAVIHLEKMPEDQALAILANLGEEERLLFANAFFRRQRFHRPRTAAFGLEVLTEAVEKNPDELLILLDLLANRHEYPALPLRNALVRGRLGLWLRRLLQMDLTAEQARYMARVAGRLRDPGLTELLAGRLGNLDDLSTEAVCRALAESPGLDPAVVAGSLRDLAATSPDPSLAAVALAALARCDEPGAAKAAAAVIVIEPGRLASLVPVLAGLSLTGFGACLRELSPDLRKAALTAVYAFLATAVPARLTEAARAVLAGGGHDPELGRLLVEDVKRRGRLASPPAPRAPGPTAPQAAAQPGESGLWNRMRGLVAAPAAPTGVDPASEALRQELATSRQVRDRQMLWKILDGVALRDLVVTRGNCKATSLVQADMTDVTWLDCQFADVNFEQASLTRVTFTRCRFANCRFSRASLEAVVLADCELRLCVFEEVAARDLTFDGTDLLECDFFRCDLAGLRLSRFRFRAVSFVRAVVRGVSAGGGLFSDSLFEMAVIEGAKLLGVRTEGCYFAGLRFEGGTDEPDLLGAMAKAEAQAMAELQDWPSAPAALTAAPGVRLLAAVVDAVLFSRDIRRRRLAMLANNKRRLAWARRCLGPEAAAFVDMLPGLVAAPWSRDARGTRPAPAARVHGLAPDLVTARNLAAYCGRPVAEVLDIPEAALPIEAIYSIGSTGTVAQTEDSDLDVWVCLGQEAAARPEIAAFTAKLDAITEQAAARHDLEIHFFVMTAQDIRDNVFGYSEDEGYGSAQGRLLKEEFYRTALCLAGRKPAWWLVPPRVTAEAHARILRGLARTEPEAAADSLDFGCLERIAGDEFFGASLWMIVKSLTSPFKSIIKFGLLDKYATEGGEPELLCETLKASIFSNQGGLWRCDPYALLFGEVSRHYRRRESAGTLELLRQAFVQKTGFDPSEEYLSRSGEAVLDHFFPYAAPAGGSCPPAPKREAASGEGGFAQIVALGDAISSYLLRAYERLKQHGASLAGGGLTERDQLMLSRRIGASFSRRLGKIMRLPFLRPGRGLFSALEFAHEETRGRDKELVFAVRGEVVDAERKTRRKEVVRQDGSLARLCAWLVANELYRPGLFLKAGNLPAPLTLPDVSALLEVIAELFPSKETFGPPLSWGLAPEEVRAALLVCNLLAPREERRAVVVDVFYATTWGELFHQERTTQLEPLADGPEVFLTDGLGLRLAAEASVVVYAPARSQCQAARSARGV